MYTIIGEAFPLLGKCTEWMRTTECALVKDANSFVEYKNQATWKERVIELFIGCNVNMENTSFMAIQYQLPLSPPPLPQQQQQQRRGGLPLQLQQQRQPTSSSSSSSSFSSSSSSSLDNMEMHISEETLSQPLPLPLSTSATDRMVE